MDKTKVIYLDNAFVSKSELPAADDVIASVYIEGYASTNAVDRVGDVIPTAVWEKGIKNYLKNPIILAYHDYEQPVGRMVDHKIDNQGLWIKARISAASEDIYNLIKDSVITAFSVGFRVLDAEYNSATELFVIKELELVEISVVPVPCNQDTLFNLAKAFKDASIDKQTREAFTKSGETAKEQEATGSDNAMSKKEWDMNPEELSKLLAEAAEKAAKATAEALATKAAAEKAAAEEAAAKEAAIQDAIAKAVEARISVEKSGTEKLLEEVTKAVEEKMAGSAKALEDLQSEIKAKAEELVKLNSSKMQFNDKSKQEADYKEIETAVLLSKIMQKPVDGTEFAKKLITKVGPHQASATWELEVSRNMEAEVRRRLVVAPIFRAISMQTNVMTFPLNPEAGLATWITNAQFGTTASPGAAQTHQLKEVTLNAYKVATMEYVAFEEEEDSLLAIMPVIRDAMVRRVARAVDRAYLYGAGSGADPVKGVAIYDATSVVTPTNTGAATIANLRAMRKDLGAWGLDPAEIIFVVSTDVYYDLLDDTSFQTVDKVGNQAATFLTGQVGVVGSSPVLVSAEFPAKAGGAATAATNIGAICVAPANFLAGNQRGLRFDTQDLVETQRRVLVSSLRTGLVQITTNLGQAVSTLRWS
jgi:HK97 family phage prohead protease/HK97 family phage major capsid protein